MRSARTGLAVLVILLSRPAGAQTSDAQVTALVEALRQAAPDTGRQDDGLYSAWQIREATLRRWSKRCAGQELEPAEFERDEARIRSILACVMGPLLQEQLAAAHGNQAEAVRRAAAWWMTGDASQWSSETAGSYTQKVLDFYQKAP